ncbi:TPA: phage tail terminator protein [Raoultella terrigena]
MKHSEIRNAVIDALIGIDANALFDGRPAVFEESDFPAVAVYLTDARATEKEIDGDIWEATLHIEVFLPGQVPDSELDEWMESKIYPVMSNIASLSNLVETIFPDGFDYQRDEELVAWSSADLKYSITYEM